MRTFTTVCLVPLFATTFAPPVLATWPHGPLTNVPVCTATGDQSLPKIASDGSGGTIIAWVDARGGSADVYVQHLLATGEVDPEWSANGLAVCTAAGNQEYPAIVADGAGGAIVTWQDTRSGANSDIYAQRVLASGAVDPAWPANGRALCTAANFQIFPVIVPDGAGGAVVAWADRRVGSYDVYAQHVLASGVVNPAWPADGRALCSATFDQVYPVIVSDGAGGAVVAWQDARPATHYDVYAQRVLASGAVDPVWPANGRALCTATGGQADVAICSDGAGGAVVTWADQRSGASDIYAQRVLISGVADPAWPADGRALCRANHDQTRPLIVSDGAGGAMVVWYDYRNGTSVNNLFAQRVQASGAVDPAWPADGQALCATALGQNSAAIATDDAGGAIVTWLDGRSGAAGAYAHHMLASAVADPGWLSDGRAVCTASGSKIYPTIVPDGAHGAIVAWSDYRNGGWDIYAQNLAPFGVTGEPEPTITEVKDLPDDQGGHVRIRWNASQLDASPWLEIDAYGIWRQVSEGAAARAAAAGARFVGARDVAAAKPGVYRAEPVGTETTWWEGVGVVLARGQPWYTFVAETFQDSTAAGNPLTTFMVDAHESNGIGYWDSAPVAGYSVDNLAPAAPAPLTGEYAAGTAHLHWNPNRERDLAGYRLYRGATAAFVPGPGNLVATLPDTGYADAAGAPLVYKLTAIDMHGNESTVAMLDLSSLVGTGEDGLPRGLAFAMPTPNPTGKAATFRFALPNPCHVRLSIYDAAGRRARVLWDGELLPGPHGARWDLRDGNGERVGPGVYFARLEVRGQVLTRRLVVF